MKLFKNKFFLVCLCIAISLCTLSTTFSLMGFREPVREVLLVVATPFRWLATVTTDAFDGFFKHFELQSALIEQNQSLQEENDRLKTDNEQAQMLWEENERLREYLGMKEKYPSYLLDEGMIVGSAASEYQTVFTLNRGTVNGISLNMPVMVEAGVIGYVTEVGLTWCKVSTILEASADSKGIGAYVSGSGTMGVVQGDFELSKQGLCKMTYIDANGDIQEGDLILSSGVGSIYPPDLVIGKVEEVRVDEYSRERIAIVRPFVDFTSLKYVTVITGYEEHHNGGYQKPVTSAPSQKPDGSDDNNGMNSSGGYG